MGTAIMDDDAATTATNKADTIQEAIAQVWCKLDRVKEASKRMQGDLHLLSHHLYSHEDLPSDAILRLVAMHGKVKGWMRTVEGCVGQVVEEASEECET